MVCFIRASFLAGCMLSTVQGITSSTDDEVKLILSKLEEDALAFRDAIEEAYASRCGVDTLSECGRNNFDDCSSVYPDQVCLQKDELVFSDCGNGDPCNALWSKSVSSVSIPAALARGSNGNPTDPELVETVCYTRQAEDVMKEKYAADEQFWAKYGVTPSWTYFGAHNGVFRIFPSAHNKQCGAYDPRKRPWYIAASSGPKDVVLVIDVSGSMSDYGRLDLAKEAARTIVDTLTVADRVGIVVFSEDASLLGGQDKLTRATAENKAILLKLISGLAPKSATNFHAGFQTAFESLHQTISKESTTGCNIAILFLTDGMITAGPGKEDVVALVKEQKASLKSKWDRDAYIFTYSLGQSADHDVAKDIACATGGLWSPVDDLDFGGDLVTSMASYYKLFAVGLGEGDNADFAAWVEPYVFSTAAKMGTTVSAPVYNRAVNPPLFLGVAAVDAHMDALERVLGENAASSTMLERFVRVSTARCPKLSLSECELDALRTLGGGAGAACGGGAGCNRTDFAGIIPTKCRGVSDYPNDVWANTDAKDVAYGRRACCEVGQSEPSDMCATTAAAAQAEGAGGLSAGAIAGIAIGAAVVLFLAVFCVAKKLKKTRNNNTARKLTAVRPKQREENTREGQRASGTGAPNRGSRTDCRSARAGRSANASVPISGSKTSYDGVRVAMPPSQNPLHVASAPPPAETGFVEE